MKEGFALEYSLIEAHQYPAGEFNVVACDESLVDAVANELAAQ